MVRTLHRVKLALSALVVITPAIQADARQELPMLHEHLASAQQLLQQAP
jgi:hypothetical protein